MLCWRIKYDDDDDNNNNDANICIARLKQNSSGALMAQTNTVSVFVQIPHERSFSVVFWEEEWLVWRPLLPEILGQADPVGAKFHSVWSAVILLW